MSDKALRKKVNDLTKLSAEDRDAILAQLDDAGRRVVLRILDANATPYAHRPLASEINGLSPWLNAKIAGLQPSSPVTALVRETLGRLDGPVPAPVSLVSRTSAFIARKVR